jgi:chromate transporter
MADVTLRLAAPNIAATPSFAEATKLWAKVGMLSFGGAAGQIAMMHRFVVDERRWVEERRFLDALNYCTLLPGPEAQQLATYLGWLMHGVRGGLVAGLLFVIPGAVFMLGLSLLYALGTGVPLIDGIFFGIKAAVLAIVAEAVIRIGRRAMKTWLLVALSVAAFLAILVLKMPFPLVILAAGAVGIVLAMRQPDLLSLKGVDGEPTTRSLPERAHEAATSALVWLAVWWAPVVLAALLLGGGHILVELGLFFSKLAVITFGGAYAVLAYLADEAVNAKHWVLAAEMIDGLGLAETTPGPTILVNQFVGFLAAMRAPGPLAPLAAATLGAIMTVWVTFVPSFLWIFAGAPFLDDLRRSPRIAGALAAITAAVVGVVAHLALWFALNVLFRTVRETVVGPLHLIFVEPATIRPDALVLSALAVALIFVLHRGVVFTVAVLAAAGAALTLLGLRV